MSLHQRPPGHGFPQLLVAEALASATNEAWRPQTGAVQLRRGETRHDQGLDTGEATGTNVGDLTNGLRKKNVGILTDNLKCGDLGEF